MLSPVMCLAAAIFFEARDQHPDGQYAVANVVINRVESPRWPNDICSVVFQERAFSFTHDGKSDRYWTYTDNYFDRKAIDTAEKIAISVINGDTLGLTSTHYHATYVEPFWTSYYEVDGRVGDHIFYTAPDGM